MRSKCALDKKKTSKKWIYDASDEHAIRGGYWFDEGRAVFAANWIQKNCVLYEGEYAGQLVSLRDWQIEATMRLFGWVKWSDHWGRDVRRFRRASIWVPKKNKKSPTLAAWGCYLLMGDGEPGQKVFCVARNRDQAMIAQTHAIKMVEKSPTLRDRCTINKATGSIIFHKTSSIMRPLPGESITSQEGLNGCILVDEAHVVDRRLMSVLKYAGISRSEPMFLIVSTAGNNTDGFGKSEFDYAADVIAGRVTNDEYFAMIHAAPQDITPAEVDKNLITIGKSANPAWGHTINEEEFTSSWQEAKKSLSDTLDFMMYRLNVWQRSANPWIKHSDWRACAMPGLTLEMFDGRRCWLALDKGRTKDMSALALVCEGDNGELWLATRFWLPEATIREYAHLGPFVEWQQSGELEATDGNTVDDGVLRREIIEWCNRFHPESFMFDPMYAETIAQDISAETGVEIVEFPQKIMQFAAPTAAFEKHIIAHTLRHMDQAVMNWQVGHVEVYQDASQNKRPVKPDMRKDDHRKIDGIVASVMALSRAIVGEQVGFVYSGM